MSLFEDTKNAIDAYNEMNEYLRCMLIHLAEKYGTETIDFIMKYSIVIDALEKNSPEEPG